MSNFTSLFFYVSAFAIASAFVGYGHRKNNKPILLIGLLTPIIIGGFRYGVGSDYFAYIDIYESYTNSSINDFVLTNGMTELGYFLLNKISQFLFNDIRLVFLTCVAITVAFFYLGLRKYNIKYVGLVFFMYLLTVFPMTLNTIRQGVALSIVFYAMTFIIERRPMKFIFWTLIASLFHTSALLMLPAYLIGIYIYNKNIIDNKGEIKRINYFYRLGIVCIIVALISSNVFNVVLSMDIFSKYELYTTYTEDSSNLIYYIKILLLGLILVLSSRIIFGKNQKLYTLFVSFACIEIIFISLGFISPFIKRQAMYFTPFSLMLLPSIIESYSDKAGKALGYCIPISYSLGFFIISYYLLGQADIIPLNFSIKGGLQ